LQKLTNHLKQETMSNFKFWTVSEMKAAITCLEKFSTIWKAAEYLAPKIDRSEGCVRNKMYQIKNKHVELQGDQIVYLVKQRNCYVKVKDRVAPKDNIEKRVDIDVVKKESISFPQGFSFDFKPSKAEMFNDHIKLYF
jgi:hypothetical protein